MINMFPKKTNALLLTAILFAPSLKAANTFDKINYTCKIAPGKRSIQKTTA
jgi:hypothetical protein